MVLIIMRVRIKGKGKEQVQIAAMIRQSVFTNNGDEVILKLVWMKPFYRNNRLKHSHIYASRYKLSKLSIYCSLSKA